MGVCGRPGVGGGYVTRVSLQFLPTAAGRGGGASVSSHHISPHLTSPHLTSPQARWGCRLISSHLIGSISSHHEGSGYIGGPTHMHPGVTDTWYRHTPGKRLLLCLHMVHSMAMAMAACAHMHATHNMQLAMHSCCNLLPTYTG